MRKPSEEELELLHVELCSALSDSTRIAILYVLAEGRRSVGEIVDSLGVPQGTVSRHLRNLRERSILRAERDGNRVYYRLAEPRVLEILTLMREILRDNLRRRREAALRIEAERGPSPRGRATRRAEAVRRARRTGRPTDRPAGRGRRPVR
jgi:DNA-binding transcriptional ArsR family regulator